MSKTPNTHDDSSSASSVSMTLLADIADITWRIFVPPITMMLLGLWADQSWGTSPWLMLSGLFSGIVLTSVLVRRQYNRIKTSQ